MRFLNEILEGNNKEIYETNLNYNLFTPYSNNLCKLLLDLIKYQTKNYFEDLVVFLFENPDTFKIIHYYYPYNNNELKEGIIIKEDTKKKEDIKFKESELKFANYYIYTWFILYQKKHNFSVRIKNQRYDILFPEEEQNKKYNPYFILNENNNLLLSKNSFLKINIKNVNNNDYEYKYSYIEEVSEINTKNMIEWTLNNINNLNKETHIKTFNEIDDLQLESYNFFSSNLSSLIGRIWSLLFNLTDKYTSVIEYLQKAFCFLETDVLKRFKVLYEQLEIKYLKDFITQMSEISFFCDSDSILWKYRILISKFESEICENNEYYKYFKSKNIDVDDEVILVKKEINNLEKLKLYWKDEIIQLYKGKLLTLQNLLISYKNKDIEDAEIIKLRTDANALLILLENKTKKKKYFFIKVFDFFKR